MDSTTKMGRPFRLTEAVFDQFWSNVDRRGPDECWPWVGRARPNGVGRVWFNGREYTARQFAYLVTYGVRATQRVIKATCHTWNCVNPSHFEARNRDNLTDDGLKLCPLCRQEKPLEAFSPSNQTLSGRHRYCRPCTAVVVRDRNYGLAPGEHDAMLAAQGGVCAICGLGNGGKAMAVDHDHAQSGVIRGLLCDRCNVGLGMFRDDVEVMGRAISYLEGRASVSASKSVGASTS